MNEPFHARASVGNQTCLTRHGQRTAGFLYALAVLSSLLTASAAAGDKERGKTQPAQADALVTRMYDVGDLIHRPGKTGWDSIEDVVKALVRWIGPEAWRGSGKGTSSITLHNGTRLEIKSTAGNHEQVKEFVQAMRRWNDVAVVLRSELCEIDAKFFQKTIKPKLAGTRPGLLVNDALLVQLRNEAAALQHNTLTIADRRETASFSWKKAILYVAKPHAGANKPADAFDVVSPGLAFRTGVALTPDRRRVRLRITQEVTELVKMRKKTAMDAEMGKETTIEVPDLARSSTSATIRVDDGQWVLLPVRYLPEATKKKGRVLVMLVQPSIAVEEEEGIRKKGGP